MRSRTGIILLILLFLLPAAATAQSAPGKTTSWQRLLHDRRGTVTALWYDIDPFIFKNEKGRLLGVEYELMESFASFVRDRYKVSLTVDWKNAGSFEQIYRSIRDTRDTGIFGWSFFSITSERQREVSFTPAYMPDLNVLVTSPGMPLYADEQPFIDTLPRLQGYTMKHTTMADDIAALAARNPGKAISSEYDDYEVLNKISAAGNGFGYVPLTVYVVALQKGIKVKRQHILATERAGFGGIFPRHSDWAPVIDTYFRSDACRQTVAVLLARYLGPEIGAMIMEGPGTSPVEQRSAEIELLTKEREIVSRRLIDTALQAEQHRIFRNVAIGAVLVLLLLGGLMYNRYRVKKRLSALLLQRNTLVRRQNRDIERINRKLHMRVLQAQINPHFMFNSLNDLQYFIHQGDKPTALSYVSRFSKFMRMLLEHANEPEITVEQEMALLQLYLELEQLRFTGQFTYRIDAGENVRERDLRFPPLLLYHYVENALYHGILNHDREGRIDIAFTYDNPHLVVVITDNGRGRKAAAQKAGTRGANDTTPFRELLKERIEIINEELPGKIEVRVEDLQENDSAAGTRVTVRFLTTSRREYQVMEY